MRNAAKRGTRYAEWMTNLELGIWNVRWRLKAAYRIAQAVGGRDSARQGLGKRIPYDPAL